MKILVILLSIVTGLLAIGWLGLQVQPTQFPPYPQTAGAVETIPLPAGLPAPVERYYRALYGDRIPVITSVVITARAQMRPVGPISFPARLRFTHDVGKGYRHYMELTWFGIPIMKGNEWFLDGHGRLELPMGTEEGPRIDQGGNLGMWSELGWFPATYLTDPRVRWEALDDVTAVLVVPAVQDGDDERYVVRFDPQTGLMTWMESMRYHNEATPEKVLWMNHALEWSDVGGQLMDTRAAAIWMDDGKPWAVFMMEDVVYNTDVSEYIRARGY